MDIDLTYEQRAQLELIALYSGSTPAQVLIEAAESVVCRQSGSWIPTHSITIPAEHIEARLTDLLRR